MTETKRKLIDELIQVAAVACAAIEDIGMGNDIKAAKYAIGCVVAERGRQLSKWGIQNHSPEKWMTILMEEVGEAAKEVLEMSHE